MALATQAQGGMAQEASPVAAPATPAPDTSSGPITIFKARKIVTQSPIVPEATHVAVRDGRVLGAGDLESLEGWGDYTLDETFADHVIIPGLIEAHCHVIEGMMAFMPYVGYYDRPAVDGGVLKGITSIDGLANFLKDQDAKLTDPDAPLITSGWDPIFFRDQPPVDRKFLDQISTTRQVGLWYASEHTLLLNSVALEKNNITSSTDNPGVVMGSDGQPTGLLTSPSAMGLAANIFDPILEMMAEPKTIQALSQFAVNAGCTMVTDMASIVMAAPKAMDAWRETVNDPSYPVRVGIYVEAVDAGKDVTPANIVESFLAVREAEQTEKLYFPGLKLLLDGSIQDLTASMKWPGYYKGTNDLDGPLMTPEQVTEWVHAIQAGGIQVAGHANGSQAIDVLLDAFQAASMSAPAEDLRHVVEHAQLMTTAQFARMVNLEVCANLFANHIYYWGDQHYEYTIGPERAEGMEPALTALEMGVPISLHTDASVTPLGCLHSMWCAVNRVTASGRVLGEREKLTPAQALHAVTLGSAYQLHLDDMMGSIEPGKFADFAVLEESPLDVDPMAIKDIKVWGTVLGGVKHQAATPSS
jgi:predicted amidohydrolase YtcJ